MPRTKLSEEELKLRRQQRNKQYYEQKKEFYKEYFQKNKENLKAEVEAQYAVVYVISGLQDNMFYVGVSNQFKSRKKAHRKKFGSVQIAPVLKFKSKVPVPILNLFEY